MSKECRKNLHVRLITHTPNPEQIIALGAKLCYSGAVIDQLFEKVTAKDQTSFIERLMSMGHESVLEHASFTFGIEGISRSLLAQVTRHRIASFSVQSQRYVSYSDGFGFIIPPAIENLGPEAVDEYEREMSMMQTWYEKWQTLLGNQGEKSNEDARFVLPNACETRLLMTMNVRELRHFFQMRMCSRAQWEIREMATQMHKLCMEVAPTLFYDAGPACLRGKCPEGAKSCGLAAQKKKEREQLLRDIEEKDMDPRERKYNANVRLINDLLDNGVLRKMKNDEGKEGVLHYREQVTDLYTGKEIEGWFWQSIDETAEDLLEEDEMKKLLQTLDGIGVTVKFTEDGRPESVEIQRLATDIDWDTDGEEIDWLPKQCVVPPDLDDDEVADWLSDRFGFCVNGFSI